MIAIYTRVSTEEQAQHGYSLAEQVRACRQKVGTTDVIEYADEGLSGEFLNRPALTKLRQDVKDGLITKFICLAPDRLSRKSMDAQLVVYELLKRKVEIEFVKTSFEDSAMGLFNFQILASVAELEKAMINERMSRGRREKARQGKVVKDYQIYGYEYDAEMAKLVVNEREAAVVRLIFDLFTGRRNDIAVKGVNGIAHYLTESGIPTKRQRGQGIWHRQVVRQLLMNPVYKGEFYQNRWDTEGMLGNKFATSDDDKVKMTERPREEWILVPSPLIIQADQFEYAQRLLSDSRRRFAGAEKHNYFLSGLLRCSDCGNTMTGRRSKNWGTYVREYIDVKNTAGAKHKGCGNRVKCDDLDHQLWETVLAWAYAPSEVAAATSDNDVTFEEAELERIDSEIERQKRGRQRLLDLLMESDDEIVEDIRQKIRQTKEQEAELSELRKRYEEMIDERNKPDHTVMILQEIAEKYLLESPDELSDEQRQELVRMIVKEIQISKDGKVRIITY